MLSLSAFSASDPLPFLLLFRFRLLSLCFFLSALPVSASQWLPRCALSAFASLAFPVLSDPISRAFLPGSSYSASCSFPFALPDFAPTAVPSVLPSCSRLRAFPSLPLSFVCFRSVLTTQPSVLSFPFFPFSPGSGSSGACFPLLSGLFPCLPSDSGTQLPAIPFSVRRLASQWLPQRLSLPISLLALSPWLSL